QNEAETALLIFIMLLHDSFCGHTISIHLICRLVEVNHHGLLDSAPTNHSLFKASNVSRL
ncbi:MAG: hypothetical protein P8J26_01965, partial [Pseudomonadales bacterium]|nr:hypothetical protein [Pseudomonadales bacterium]